MAKRVISEQAAEELASTLRSALGGSDEMFVGSELTWWTLPNDEYEIRLRVAFEDPQSSFPRETPIEAARRLTS